MTVQPNNPEIVRTRHKYLGRWRFLSLAALFLGALVLAACSSSGDDVGGATATSTAGSETPGTTNAPGETTAPGESVTLQIEATQPEYLNADRQIWDIFEAENPGVTIELFSVNEAEAEAYAARRAGGFFPAIENHGLGSVDGTNFENYVNLLEVDTEWLDRWTYDVRNQFTNQTGIEGLYTLETGAGWYFTWQYNAELMDELGLDPRAVKTQEDFKALLADGTAAVAERDDIEFFWDQAWNPWIFQAMLWNTFPMGFSDGQDEALQQSWLGEIDDPSKDPFRYMLEFHKEAYDAGQLPNDFWLRDFEADMEANYIAGNAVMIIQGPWVWDKMLAANPAAVQLGIPATPPLQEGDPWIQRVSPPDVTHGFKIPIENLDTPEWPLVLKAFNFWNSPEIVLLRHQIRGTSPAYELDETLELEGGQWQGILKEFQPGGLYENVEIRAETEIMAQHIREDGSDTTTWQWTDIWGAVMNDEMSIAEALDWFHDQVSQNYDLP